MKILDFFFRRKKPSRSNEVVSDEPKSNERILVEDYVRAITRENEVSFTLKEPALVIGMGTLGTNIVEKLIKRSPLSADYLIKLGFDLDVYKGETVRNRIMLNERDSCGTTLEHDMRRCYSTETFDHLLKLYGKRLDPIVMLHPEKVVIITGLGGTNGFGMISVVKHLMAYGINVIPIVTMPFRFEGERKKTLANRAKEQLQSLCVRTKIFNLDDVVARNSELTLYEALSTADEEIVKIVEDVLRSDKCTQEKTANLKPMCGKNQNKQKPKNKMMCGITPTHVDTLEPNEVFVFGSNLEGRHCGGAARTALRNFGAIMGNGVGLQGQSYAIPTMQGGVETIKPYVDDFVDFASRHNELHFLVTRIGCGIAGFKDTDIAPLFADCVTMSNVSLPSQFITILTGVNEITEEYGQIQTLCDIIKTLNDHKHYTNVNDLHHDMVDVINSYAQRGTISATTRQLVISGIIKDDDIFVDGIFSTDKLQKKLLKELRLRYNEELSEPMNKRDVAKFIGLLLYLNDFRRYTSAEQIIKDFAHIGFDEIGSCGDYRRSPLNDRLFSWMPFGGHAYPSVAFFRALSSLWDKVSTDGTLDNQKLQDKMIDEYQNGKQSKGLAQVVREHYMQDGPCHPEVYFPKDGFYGPVLVDNQDGTFAESCGEGKGPNKSSDFYEFQLLRDLIIKDSKYVSIGNDCWWAFIVPKEDFTLPVFGPMGKLHFTTQEEKVAFILNKLRCVETTVDERDSIV